MRALEEIRAFLLDMDGTFFVDNRLLPGALDLLQLLEKRRHSYLFLTNNSSASAEDYQQKLARLGIQVPRHKVLTSGEATVRYLKGTAWRRLFVLGTPTLEREFVEAGFLLTDSDPECVVLGFDTTLTYDKLTRACLLVAHGLPYVATHPDLTCITAQGLIPDAGALIAAVECVTHRRPTIIGKPEPEMVAAALERLGAAAKHTAMVGDQLDTDMTMAQRGGLFGVLVLSGETSRQRLVEQEAVRPDLVVEHVGELYQCLMGLPS